MSLTAAFNTAAQDANDSLLLQAVKFGNAEVVELLLKQGANVNAPTGASANMPDPEARDAPTPVSPPPQRRKPAANLEAQDMKTEKPVKAVKTVRFAGKKPKRDIKPL